MRQPIRGSTSFLPPRRTGLIGAVGVLVLFCALIALRAAVLYEVTDGLADCPICMAATAAQQDATLYALLLVFTGLAFLTRRYWLQLPWLLLSACLIFVYAIDATVTKTLTQRLYLFDVIKFGKELSAITRFSNIFLETAAGKLALAVALVGIAVLVLAALPRPSRPRMSIYCFVAAVPLALLGRWQPPTMQYIHNELLLNLLAANLNLGVDKPYSAVFERKIAEEYAPPQPLCEAGQALHPNVIVVAVESLSTHHSQLFGGFRDLTPRLDAMAREHTYFPDFIANGFTTDGGMIAMITGQSPIPQIGRYQSAEAFAGFDDPHGALPEIVHAQGYTAHFFTTGDLGFLDKSKWLKTLQFDSWEGAEQPFYEGWKRRHFNAAEDKALYLRFLQWLDARKDNAAPYLAYVLTVSTHPPFINPQTDQPDELGAFRYADAQLGMFYDELQKRGFFSNGILLVSGDHRSMSPLWAQEQQRFGSSALARTPFVVATDLPIARGAIASRFSQTDIAPSIADMTGAQSCRTPAQGVFLRAQPQAPQYITHVGGDRRNDVDIYFEQQRAKIALDGDATRWIGPQPENWRQIYDGILLDRMRRGAVNENIIDEIVRLRTPQPPPATTK
ncbi:MAG: LTA synthase family protein [Gammaproteobacteria bacterium]|nr:MAG: LTA synthase family protein [Gammaproteobacteria bacterium]